MLAELPAPFQRCLELAWESCARGTIGVGAVITDEHDAIVAEGRNRIFDRSGGTSVLQGTRIAHAEMNALACTKSGAPLDRCTLWTSLQPCLMCASAAVLAGVGTVRYLAPDPLFFGIESIPDLNAFTRRRWPSYHGPHEAEWAIVAGVIAHHLLAFWEPNGLAMAALTEHESETATLLRSVVEERLVIDAATRGETLESLLECLWPRAVEAHARRSAVAGSATVAEEAPRLV
jgi:tRNA(Arg) A34 adenosine deaminase TadA